MGSPFLWPMIGWLLFGPNHEKLSCLDAPTAAPRGAPDPSFQLTPFSVCVFHHLIEQGVPLKFQRGTVPFEHGLLRGPSPRFASGPSSLFFWRHHPRRDPDHPCIGGPDQVNSARGPAVEPHRGCDPNLVAHSAVRQAQRPLRAAFVEPGLAVRIVREVPLIVAQKCADGLDDRAVFAAPLLGQAFYFPGRKKPPHIPSHALRLWSAPENNSGAEGLG